MVASLAPAPLIAALAADSSDDLATSLFILALVCVLACAIAAAVWLETAARSKAERGNKQPPATNAAREAPSPSRRGIPLHSTTPGQSPDDYNIGDDQGTRGSVRAA